MISNGKRINGSMAGIEQAVSLAQNSYPNRRFWNLTAAFLVAFLMLFAASSWAGVGGSISGTVTDASGALVAKASVTATNTATGVQQAVATDPKGFYSFPSLSIGHYDIEVASAGFRPYRRTEIVINANSALVIDATLQVGEVSNAVTVIDNE